MYRCIYSLEEYETASAEHILQNCFGARWTSDAIVCEDVQRRFGQTIDVALAEPFKLIRNSLNLKTGRGKESPTIKRLESDCGSIFDLRPGCSPRLNKPNLKTVERPDGKRGVEILLDGKHHLGWALSALRRRIPNLSIDEGSVWNTKRTIQLPTSTLHISHCLGGADYFRGMLKSCFNLLAVNYPDLAVRRCFDAIRQFVINGKGDFDQFIRWSSCAEALDVPRLGLIDHAIFIVSRESSVEGVVQFFGQIIHPFQLTNNYDGEPVRCGYTVNPFRDSDPTEIRNPIFADNSIPWFSRQQIGITSTALNALETRLTRLARLMSFNKALNTIFTQAYNETLASYEGRPLTPGLLDLFTRSLVDHLSEDLTFNGASDS